MNTKVKLPKPRNWVAKNNHNRCSRHKIEVRYQRRQKHQQPAWQMPS